MAVTVLLLGPLAACGEDGAASSTSPESAPESASESELESELESGGDAADQTLCRAEVDELSAPYDAPFPPDWAFPPETTAYDVEEVAEVGTIVTAVSEAPFDDVLDFLNRDAVDAGFEITEGETEEDDAEANWTSADWSGRWTMRRSTDCPGEIVLQVLAAPRS